MKSIYGLDNVQMIMLNAIYGVDNPQMIMLNAIYGVDNPQMIMLNAQEARSLRVLSNIMPCCSTQSRGFK